MLLGKIKNRFVGSKLLKPNNKQCSGWIVSDTLPFDKDSWSFGVKNKVGAGSEKIVVLFLRGWRRVLRRQAVNIKETK